MTLITTVRSFFGIEEKNLSEAEKLKKEVIEFCKQIKKSKPIIDTEKQKRFDGLYLKSVQQTLECKYCLDASARIRLTAQKIKPLIRKLEAIKNDASKTKEKTVASAYKILIDKITSEIINEAAIFPVQFTPLRSFSEELKKQTKEYHEKCVSAAINVSGGMLIYQDLKVYIEQINGFVNVTNYYGRKSIKSLRVLSEAKAQLDGLAAIYVPFKKTKDLAEERFPNKSVYRLGK